MIDDPLCPFSLRPTIGASNGDQVEIRAGVFAGDKVVVAGSFVLRSERDRLGWPSPK
jgi:multidrug efflux pump subunit AcrA (membrane-fusion protein)